MSGTFEIAAIAAWLVSAPAGAGRTLVDRIVAVVNDDVVTLSELELNATALMPADASEARKKEVYGATLENLIADRLVTQQIEEAKIDVSPEDIDRAIDDIVAKNKITREDLTQAIEARGMQMARYRKEIEGQLVRLKLVDLKVRSRVVIPESDIRAEYEQRVAGQGREEVIKLRHLFFRWGESPDKEERLRVLARANAARAQVAGGEDFGAVAAAVSDGPTAQSGGELGELSRSELLPELSKAAAGLKVMEVSGPIETPNGVHIIRIDAARKKEPPTYEKMRNEIYQQLYQAEVEKQMASWIEELKAQAAIERRM